MKLRKLVAAAAVMMSFLVVSTNAAFSDQDQIKNTEAVEMNVMLSILRGRDDGSFDPQGQITRAEMAKVIYMILNGGSDPALDIKPTSSFQDIKGHWAESYIEFCISMGSVSGLGDGNFNPDGSVTCTQAAKMLLVLLGYDAQREQFSGPNWFLKINAVANQKNLYHELTVDPNAALTRDEAAQMIWNALNASEIEYQPSTNVTGQTNSTFTREDKEGTLLESKFHTDGDCKGKMIGYRWNESQKRFDYEIQEQGIYFSKTDYTHLFGFVVNVIHQSDETREIYGMYAPQSKVLAVGVVGDLEKSNKDKQIQFHKVSYAIDYAVPEVLSSPEDALDALPVYAENDGQTQETYLSASLSSHQPYELRLIDQDGNGKVDYAIYLPFGIGQVSEVSAISITVKDFDLNHDKEPLVLDRSSHRIYKGIAVNDYVKIIPQENTPYEGQVIPLSSFEGTVSDIMDDKILVNGTWYYNHNSLPVEKDSNYKFYTEGSYLYYIEKI